VAEDDDRSLLGRQILERRDHLASDLLGRRQRLEDRIGAVDPAAQRFATGPVECPVDDDSVQPGPERPPPVEAVEGADGGEEGVLGDVLAAAASWTTR
jgi:hypothetical protein